jgi:hypothetical protein
MAAVPGVLGGRLAGLVRLPEAAYPEDGFTVSVACTRIRGGGKRRHQDTLWEDSRILEAGAVPVTETGPALPVLFALPYDLPASGERQGGVIRWRLRVQGRQPGIDVDLQFDLPVFRTKESRPDFVLDENPIASFTRKN